MVGKMKSWWVMLLGNLALSLLMLSAVHAQAHEDNVVPDEQARIARGAYLVEGLGHCGACHTPRGVGMQELAYNSLSTDYLSGAVIEGWLASDLRTLTLPQDELVALLKYGIAPSKGMSGPMKEVVTLSTQYATDEDLESIAAYLRSIRKASLSVLPQPLPMARQVAEEDPQGAFLYYTYCSVCHGEQGEGIAPAAPRLAGNSNVVAWDPRNMIRIIAHGEQTPVTMAHPPYVMPAYEKTLTREEIVKIINHMRTSWGNEAAPITEKQYSDLLK